MKRKCHATGPHHNDPCTRGKVWCPNANYKQDCDHCHGTGEVEDHRASTAITPDGLRGLGMERANAVAGVKWSWIRSGTDDAPEVKLNVYRWNASTGWYTANIVKRDGDDIDEVCLGTAPNLEWVAAMIGLLKQANGEG